MRVRKQILLVTDCGDRVRERRMLLRVWGYEPAVAANEDEAVAWAARNDVRLAVIDLEWRGLDGQGCALRLVERLKAANPDTRTLLLVHRADEARRLHLADRVLPLRWRNLELREACATMTARKGGPRPVRRAAEEAGCSTG